MNLARATSLIGSVTLLSYTFLLLVLDQSHHSLLWMGCIGILASFWLSRFPQFEKFYSIHSLQELKLSAPAVAPPAHNQSEVVFLLKTGGFAIYDLQTLECLHSHALGMKWECLPPVWCANAIGAWAKGRFVIFSRQGKILSTLAVPFQGVSLSFQKDSHLYIGSTQEFIHQFSLRGSTWKSYSCAGIPIAWDESEEIMFTSSGSLYKFTKSGPEQIRQSQGLPLGFIALPGCQYFFEASQKIYGEAGGERFEPGFYHKDFFYPFKAGDFCLFVDRDRWLCRAGKDGSVHRDYQFPSSPIWVRHNSHYLVVGLQRKSQVELMCWSLRLEDFSEPMTFTGNGALLPLGMGDHDLFFSVTAQKWYHWNLKENSQGEMDGEAPAQVLVCSDKVLMYRGGSWFHSRQELSDCSLKVEEGNYEYQALGFFPIG